jgi:hypothetical protein
MTVPGFLTKSFVLGWALVLGVVFIVGYTAVVVLGTKSANTFKYYSTKAGTQPAAPPSPGSR